LSVLLEELEKEIQVQHDGEQGHAEIDLFQRGDETQGDPMQADDLGGVDP
jgi:hypothetical protein